MVGLLAAGVVGLALVGLFIFGSPKSAEEQKANARPDGKGTTLVGRPAYEAKDEVCQSGLRQVRQAITIATDPVENTFPEKLESLRLGSNFTACPIGKEAYVYDPSTGQVKCPHPGHESY
jgi:hypothetical protein